MKAKVWLFESMAGWHFVSIPKKESTIIKSKFGLGRKGWGSIPVNVTVGETTWQTSIFPESKTAQYLMPIKAVVRKKEGVKAGKTISLTLEIRI